MLTNCCFFLDFSRIFEQLHTRIAHKEHTLALLIVSIAIFDMHMKPVGFIIIIIIIKEINLSCSHGLWKTGNQTPFYHIQLKMQID